MEIAYPNGQTSHFAYSSNLGDRRLQHLTHQKPNAAVISAFTYAYNPTGEITNWVQQLGAVTQTWSIGYDPADQLTTVVQNGTSTNTFGYTYDAAGNRLTETTNNLQRSFAYNALNELLSSSDVGTTNVIYEWDAEQRLTAINQGTNRSEFSYRRPGEEAQNSGEKRRSGTNGDALRLVRC